MITAAQHQRNPQLLSLWLCDTYHFGFERWLHLPPLQRLPVHGLEERVQTDITHNPQPASGIPLKQLQGNRRMKSETSVSQAEVMT